MQVWITQVPLYVDFVFLIDPSSSVDLGSWNPSVVPESAV